MGAENVLGTRASDAGDLLPLTPVALNILLALADGERHGYGIMLEVRERTGAKVRLGPGTLYGAIKRLKEGGLIEESGERDPTPRRTTSGAATTASPASAARSWRQRSHGSTTWSALRAARAPSPRRSQSGGGVMAAPGGPRPRGRERVIGISQRVYRSLLRAYPRQLRDEYGDEMVRCFRDLCREALHDGGVGLAALWVRTLPELLATALKERSSVVDRQTYRSVAGVALVTAFILLLILLRAMGLGPVRFRCRRRPHLRHGAHVSAGTEEGGNGSVPIRCRHCARGGIPSRLDEPCRRAHRVRGQPRQPDVWRGARRRLHRRRHRALPAPGHGPRVGRHGAGAGIGSRDCADDLEASAHLRCPAVLGVNAIFVMLFVGSAMLFRSAARDLTLAGAAPEG